MSPLQMAKEQCANLVGGTCLDIPWRCLDGSRPMVGQERDGCKLSDPKARCEYFEVVVAPLAKSFSRYVSAVEQYNDRLPLNKHLGNARRCGCGTPLQKRHRYCPKCKRERQKQARRKWWRNEGSGLDS